MPPQLEKNHVVPTAWQDEALARDGAEMERKPEVPASPRGEALFRCARPSGVPRGLTCGVIMLPGTYSHWGLQTAVTGDFLVLFDLTPDPV